MCPHKACERFAPILTLSATQVDCVEYPWAVLVLPLPTDDKLLPLPSKVETTKKMAEQKHKAGTIDIDVCLKSEVESLCINMYKILR